ncbi:MAG: hypothetical protein HQ538_05330 [Parcubacteria group bacterium]|nr:hypothetical protein [Parcubacteria group bacterium]
MSDTDKRKKTSSDVGDTQEIQVSELEEERVMTEREIKKAKEEEPPSIGGSGSKPPPVPTKKKGELPPKEEKRRLSQEMPSEIIAKLRMIGWTELKLRLGSPTAEDNAGFSIAVEGSFLHEGRRFEVATLLSRDCQTVARQIFSAGSSSSKNPFIFTAKKILEQERREKEKGEVITKLQTDRQIMFDKASLLFNKLIEILEQGLAAEGIRKDTTLWLIHDFLTDESTWQASYSSSLPNGISHTSSISGSCAADPIISTLLTNLNEAVIRGVDTLYTLLGLILIQRVKIAIAQDLPESLKDLKLYATDPRSIIRTSTEGPTTWIVMLVPFARKKPSA